MTTATQKRKVERALADIETAKQGQAPEVVDFWDAFARLIKTSGDPDAVFEWFFDAIERDRAKAAS